MNQLALFLKNKTKPGKRDEVYRLWDKHCPRLYHAHRHHAL